MSPTNTNPKSSIQSVMSKNRDSFIAEMISNLPRSSAFSQLDCTQPNDVFPVYLPTGSTRPAVKIQTDNARCLIRALKKKPSSRKRAAEAPLLPPAGKRKRGWTGLERERKQACLRVALAAATKNEIGDECLRSLKQGWVDNPRRRQLVNGEVRKALCRSLMRWSVRELKEYLDRAGLEVVDGVESEKMELVQRVHAHLAPEDKKKEGGDE